MKKVGSIVLTFLVFTMISFSPAILANHMENMGEYIQTLRQASTELQATNPDLSKKLSDWADKKEKWQSEKSEKWDKHKEQKEADLAKIKQASSELKGKNDSLSKDLDEIVGRWEKRMEDKEDKPEKKQ